MSTRPKHVPLSEVMLTMGEPKGAARPVEDLRDVTVTAPHTVVDFTPGHVPQPSPRTDVADGIFSAREAPEPRSGITIRIKVSAAARLDRLASRTGRKKQAILDAAIDRLLDDADRAGGLTLPF